MCARGSASPFRPPKASPTRTPERFSSRLSSTKLYRNPYGNVTLLVHALIHVFRAEKINNNNINKRKDSWLWDAPFVLFGCHKSALVLKILADREYWWEGKIVSLNVDSEIVCPHFIHWSANVKIPSKSVALGLKIKMKSFFPPLAWSHSMWSTVLLL